MNLEQMKITELNQRWWKYTKVYQANNSDNGTSKAREIPVWTWKQVAIVAQAKRVVYRCEPRASGDTGTGRAWKVESKWCTAGWASSVPLCTKATPPAHLDCYTLAGGVCSCWLCKQLHLDLHTIPWRPECVCICVCRCWFARNIYKICCVRIRDN